jgi:hypothetical protein
MKENIVWKHGENEQQQYYEAKVGNDYLCVFCNKWSPDCWSAMVNNHMIYNKTKNDRQRKKQGLPKSAHVSELHCVWLLTGSPEYLMKKAAYCYNHNIYEISA